LDKLQTFSQNLSFTETVDGSADEVTSLKDQLKGFSTALTVYDEKLSMLIEGSVRRVVQIEKGEEWVKGFTIRSVSDVVNYVRERIGQTEQWAKRGTTILGDLLRNTVGHLHTATFLSPKDMLMLIGCTHPSSGIRGAQTAFILFSTFLHLRPVSAANDVQTSINGGLEIRISNSKTPV
jgi:hypothetical protein